ncbi:MAG: AbrB/MazE/SpoVT family DNA-binding domain-containing protein [Elusimicrobia bacterium]|jgi:AbrB family looped-hinge helix DNA binding protein|nr:AbrB/MazE/SpoVT family DNA-binding domain-containing protein [Elusimicrobiota bacterium]
MDKPFKPNYYGTATVGTRGQVTIPVEALKKNDIKPGDKLLVISGPHNGGISCMHPAGLMEFMENVLEFKETIAKDIDDKNK